MNRIKCPQCGLVNRLGVPACLRCKTPFTESEGDAEHSPEAFNDDFSETFEYEPDRSSSLWTTIMEHRRSLAWIAGLVVVALLLNQTQFVSSWFVSQDVGAALKTLEERAAKSKSEKVREAADRVASLAIHASRGRQKAIRELINLDGETLAITVPNPDTEEREKMATVTAYGPYGPFSGYASMPRTPDSPYEGYNPGQRSNYLSRSASIGEYVDDILVHIGEPAVEPIMERIAAVQAARRAGDKTTAAAMPGGLSIVLGRIKSPKALDRLIEYASEKPYSFNNVVLMEALCFYQVDDPRLVQVYDMALTEAANENQAGVSNGNFNSDFAISVACAGLAKINSQSSLNVLLTHLELGEPGWRSHVVQAIARHGSTAVPGVLEVINSSAPKLARENALATLGVLKAKETKSDVVALLDHRDLHEAAMETLVQWADVEMIPDLEAAAQRHTEWNWKYWDAINRLKRKASNS